MAGRSGTALVLDVDSGRVLAQYRPDVAARRLVRPGSAIKPFTLLALLNSGRVKPEQPVVCRRELRLAGHKLDCSHPQMAQPMTAVTALAYSCNSYFAQMAALLTDAELNQSLMRAGLTAMTNLVDGEVAGVIRSPGGVEQRQLLALGEENIRITPLELLAAYRRLALMRKQPAASPALQAVFDGLEGSATYGMGRLAQVSGLEVAGKTGTASAEGGWTYAWFAGYAPAKSPQVVLVIFLERGGGGLDAAPIAGEVLSAFAAAQSSR